MSGQTGLKPLVTTVFVPAAIFGIGQGAAAPVMALTARELGASVAVSGLIVAVVGLGAVLGDLPAGRIVAKFGERRSIIGGSTVGAVGVLVCLLAQTPWMLGVGALLTGLANAVWGLARQSYLADAVPIGLRARAMSSFAAMWRLGFFVGPLLGAAVILVVGARGGFMVQFVGVVLSGWLMSRVPDPPRRSATASAHATLPSILRRHRKLLATLGAGSLLMGAARASREAVLPLWAAHLGLDAAQVSLVFGVGAAVDLLCSYPAGHFMDRYGRRFIAVPSLLVIGTSYLALPFSHDLLSIGIVAVVMGIGNGLGNGVIMTLGADIAPPATRAEFLAAWRLTHDTGMFAGPFGVGALAAVVPLGAAVAAIGGAALVGAGLLFRFIPVYSPWPPPATPAPDSPPLEKQEA
ncbi:MFS transporter [Rhodococcus jostii]|uniref:Predicted arabinose efflux permease, MFS family n=1 Tax=Rhodococcus jostii TaxID=132919 RepID=A0A1H4YYI8_RHOJO|nr:MFS transporter [Rhodococcus jostii]SED22418.1 Predicted arabinose efflux permease, MFS family [Rhodococcus jostii]